MRLLLRRVNRGLCVAGVVAAVGAATFGLPAGAAQPGGNGEIVFTRRMPDYRYELFAVNPDGTGLHPLTQAPEQAAFPSFFAAGSKIAYSGDLAATMNPDGSGKQALPGIAPRLYLRVSPDGTHFMYEAGDDSNAKIETVNFDGSGTHRLFPDSGEGEWFPTWAPDSRRIAYIRIPSSGRREVWVTDSDGANAHFVAALPPFSGSSPPSFSPDGHRIAFAGTEYLGDGVYQPHLFLVGDAGGEVTDVPVTLPATGFGSPSFSPDGQRLVFAASGASPGLYSVAIDGTNLIQLTSGSDDDDPQWQPLTAANLPTTTTTTTSTTSTTVLSNAAPKPIITLATSGRTLQVSGARSTDPDGTVASYQWLWGDKAGGTARTKSATHTYAYAGTYRVVLTVTDDDGATASTETWVHVN
ncbi:MAG TPA: PKD domain-containing protein [Acidimicrobiales bacterium]|nr:PKD domain-containing protein [Acidimicrobiales bacterium]